MESLVLRDNLISDLTPIQKLANLKNLDLSGNRLSNLSTLAPLPATSLRILNLSNNRLLGLTGIGTFVSLAQLDVSNNALIDLEGVGNLQGLVNFMLRVTNWVESRALLIVIEIRNLILAKLLPMRAEMERGIPIHFWNSKSTQTIISSLIR